MKKLRISIAVILLISSFLLKGLYNHDYYSYSNLYTANIFLNIIGLGLILYPQYSRLESQIPKSFQLYPKKWILGFIKSMGIMALLVILHVAILFSGEKLNDKWVNIQINKNPEVAVGQVENDLHVGLVSKFGKSIQRFNSVHYSVNGKEYILRTRINANEHVIKGKRMMVKYLKENPNLAIIQNNF